jgi:ferredoxin
MKIEIDLGLCQGHGQCVESAPEVFEIRDDGYAYLLVDAVRESERANVLDAAKRCPAEAILISE